MLKKIFLGAIVVIIIAAICTGAYFWYAKYQDVTYNNAIKFIERYNYDSAMTRLKEINERRDKNFTQDACIGANAEKYYKDSAALYAYARALYEFDNAKNMKKIDGFLKAIPEAYKGDLSEGITAFKKRFENEYSKYMKKNEDLETQREEVMREKYKDNIPSKGMSEEFIDDTLIGKSDKMERDDANDIHKYIWYTDYSEDITTEVICKNGKVTEVKKYGMGYYWKDELTPDFSARKPN